MSADTVVEPTPNRTMILISIILAAMMTALDQTIANVALPHMSGSLSASADQAAWVLTSYIIAAAIAMPATGWLVGRFGRKRVFVTSIVGFTLASALCGAAQNLEQIVLFRVLQGAFGASLMPLSQAVILDTYSLEERGPVLSIWAMASMVAPIAGPVLGGWLTDSFNWRWVFYVNLPVGTLCALAVSTFLHDQEGPARKRFDLMGFALLSITLAAFQLVLDRGQTNDWFHSTEIQIEAATAALAFVLFVIHTATVDAPFMPLELLADRNFVTGALLIVGFGIVTFSVTALLPPLTQTLLGYPVLTSGLMSMPRGIGATIAVFIGGRIVGRVDYRPIIIAGIVMTAISLFGMSHFSLQMDASPLLLTALAQGFGIGLAFMPLSILPFATLSPALRADGTSFFSLIRALGSSAGISIMEALVVQKTQIAHARLTEGLTPYNPLARSSMGSPEQIAALNAQVNQQASMISYVGVFHLMFVAALAVIPLVLLLRTTRNQIPLTEALAAD